MAAAVAVLRRRGALLAVALLAPLLAACENSATSFTVDSSQHAVVLMREQPYFWADEVEQAIVVTRLPHCQRKVAIHPDTTAYTPIEVFEAGSLLWALHQGERWYLASTERCLVQDWNNPGGGAPGPAVGTFRLRDGEPVFEPAA
ncbi:hypothetical protein [Pseudazoarcus pumilus]|uniref:Lipoprotein n=1 Tax=Pseudazoarcus pumilus TaxID=2067960 RepID=A0A2I6S8Q9_9RHOO|nr:hypothetical protein [Pseudazoarcus pumilus]AUN95644.1 hypothetical protein C0099_12325 [Pseudazoarcus pumilus]